MKKKSHITGSFFCKQTPEVFISMYIKTCSYIDLCLLYIMELCLNKHRKGQENPFSRKME